MTGRRLMLRLTTRCNSGCDHCTIADIAHHPDKTLEEASAELVQGRQTGCTELVVMRGEATLQPKVLLKLTRRARSLGYTHVQLQTNARMLSYGELVDRLMDAGMTFFEVSIFGHDTALHDAVDGTEGAFDQAIAGLRNLVDRGAALMVTVPV
ncbi:MAG: radical SAM protein, partial [Myxococcota bacterium]|nr:radical SAM protein [Myxococcota bacterium]